MQETFLILHYVQMFNVAKLTSLLIVVHYVGTLSNLAPHVGTDLAGLTSMKM